ncbi:exported hypothetical protein [Desulfamplus magnetovallimortis]|uniref:Uncharacterized protein n=1 Tax=Desulfamplus magnetovallimortis TaxID=1246637 RepID=A0A1W1HET8_9BACT|nr:hypothetical protein [Desulfamplus magnetovallimortis]SLM30946.1 exported hypothetical protein [Desulfamplus magnetovallimortis]
MKKIILGIIIIIAFLIFYFFFQSTPVDSIAYSHPPAPPLNGVMTPNTLLKEAILLGKGIDKGNKEIFIDNLPGFPDNISSNRNGRFWVALFTIRNPIADALHPFPFLKDQMSKLPKIFWPKPKPYGLVIALDEQGKITQSLHDPTGKHLKEVTSVREYGGYLYLGSLHNDRIGKYRLE